MGKMTRAEHLEWAKQRARDYLDQGEIDDAYASFVSDQGKHPDLDYDMMLLGLGYAHRGSVEQMRKFIEGFN